MYGKIFDSIYDGTLRADWKALITFQQLIILSGPDGVVDMTPHAIHGRTGIPLDLIEHGLKVLAEPDPYSRSTELEGRRIVLIDEHRPWGWRLVNHAYYRDLLNRADKREKDRIRIADKRKKPEKSGMSQDVAGCSGESQGVADVAHTNADANTDTTTRKTTSGKPDSLREQAKEILQFLNSKTGKAYQPVAANLDLIIARLKEGFTTMQIKQVIAKKTREWLYDEKMAQYLRPKTLFNRTNFANYVGELVVKEAAHG